MKKKWIALITVLLLAFAMANPVQAQPAEPVVQEETLRQSASTAAITVLVDGKPVHFGEAAPLIEQGHTLAPLPPLFEALNIRSEEVAVVRSDSGDAQTMVVGTKLGLAIAFLPDAPIAEINGAAIEPAVPPRLANGQLYIPVRLAAETAGYDVGWDAATRTVQLERRTGGQGFLWEVTHGGTTVHLLGSIHLAGDWLHPLPPTFEAAFDAADYIGVEVDTRQLFDPEIQELLVQGYQLQDGTTLKDHISEETYRLLGERLAELGLPEDAYDAFKPWAVSQMLSAPLYADADMTPEFGIEQVVLMSAEARQLPVIELESVEFQLEMFDRFSPEYQEEELLNVLLYPEQNAEGLDYLIDTWVTGDDEKLAGLVEITKKESADEYYRIMLEERNINMTEQIKGYLESDQPAHYLVVVGALHMLGEHGIVTLLEEAGYTVIRK